MHPHLHRRIPTRLAVLLWPHPFPRRCPHLFQLLQLQWLRMLPRGRIPLVDLRLHQRPPIRLEVPGLLP